MDHCAEATHWDHRVTEDQTAPKYIASDHNLEYNTYPAASDEKARHPLQFAIQSRVLFHRPSLDTRLARSLIAPVLRGMRLTKSIAKLGHHMLSKQTY